MKNAIFFYYNLNPITITERNKIFEFQLQNNSYVLIPCTRTNEEVEVLYKLSILLYERGIPVHQIVLNKDNQLVTFINQIPYVLFRVYIQKDIPLIMNDILNFQKLTEGITVNNLPLADWYQLWTQKIDYLEYQMSEFGKKYPLLRESFSYYVGVSENCITLVGNLTNIEKKTLSHRRLYTTSTLFDLYNPLNFVMDSKVRDICEFLKDGFFHGKNVLEEAGLYFRYQPLSETDYQLFFIRMLFPSYYFDQYEKIIEMGHPEKELLPVIHNTENYESLIAIFYTWLQSYGKIPEILWMKKSN